jgi:hypothetical protein
VPTPQTSGGGLCYRAAVVPRFLALPYSAALVTALASCAAPLDEARRGVDAPPPSSPDAVRLVLAPVDLAVVGSRGSGGGGELPEAVALGRGAGGTVVMLFRFAAPWHDDAEVMSAFLVLDPLEGAPPASSPITFETARITEPWQPGVVSWGRQPRLGLPRAAGAIRVRSALPLRVDVTPLVREWARRDAADHGIALLAHGADAFGAVVTMGVAQGSGPRLEVYVR